MADSTILTAANRLLACLCAQLELNPDPPQNCCLRAGDLVLQDVDAQGGFDKTCCPGTAYVRIGAMYPSSNFPAPDEVTVKCYPVAWAVELVMGTIRCIPRMGDPAGPDCDDWTLVATHDANDMNAMMLAGCCWADQLPRGRLFQLGTSTPRMSADCIERVMPVVVQLPKCC